MRQDFHGKYSLIFCNFLPVTPGLSYFRGSSCVGKGGLLSVTWAILSDRRARKGRGAPCIQRRVVGRLWRKSGAPGKKREGDKPRRSPITLDNHMLLIGSSLG
jgi:hypothetical protein